MQCRVRESLHGPAVATPAGNGGGVAFPLAEQNLQQELDNLDPPAAADAASGEDTWALVYMHLLLLLFWLLFVVMLCSACRGVCAYSGGEPGCDVHDIPH